MSNVPVAIDPMGSASAYAPGCVFAIDAYMDSGSVTTDLISGRTVEWGGSCRREQDHWLFGGSDEASYIPVPEWFTKPKEATVEVVIRPVVAVEGRISCSVYGRETVNDLITGHNKPALQVIRASGSIICRVFNPGKAEDPPRKYEATAADTVNAKFLVQSDYTDTYVNGVKPSYNSITTGISASPIRLLANSAGLTTELYAYRIYDRILTEAELQHNWLIYKRAFNL